MANALTDKEFIRYSAQIMLPEIGEAGQLRLKNSRVLIIGLGGLGCSVAAYLVAAGIGSITLVDNDAIELSNLQRQVIYQQTQTNKPKATSAKRNLALLNDQVEITTVLTRFGESSDSEGLIKQADLVLDCTDNMSTRQAINAACIKYKKPLIVGAAIGFDGQLICFDASREDSACYHCLYPFKDDESTQRCASLGVLGPVVGTIGTLQALEAIKYLTGLTVPSFNRLLRFDGRTLQSQHLNVQKNPACQACHSQRNEA